MEEDASARVQLAIASPTGYAENAELIFENLAYNSKAYTDSFTKSLAQVFPSTDYPPVSKFYALYLLAKASESKNEFLAMRILKQRPLLDKLFKDCQYDGAKPMNERGKTFFSKTPKTEEIILGGNYIRLLLELFTFWNKTYGTTDNQNPLHAYQVMFNTLAQKINFPETFLYLTKTYMITEDFHLLPPPSLPSLDALRSRSNSPERSVKSGSPDLKNSQKMSDLGSSQKKSEMGGSQNIASPNKPITSTNQAQVNNNTSPTNPTNKLNTNTASPITVHTTVSNIGDDVKACIPSGKLYKQKSPKVFDVLRKSPSSKESISAYINVTREVLKSKEYPPASKFYAIYLLLRLTETRTQPLILGLATNQDLLNELFLQAQVDRQKETKERGKKIFSQSPTSDEAKLGHNYLTLITEALIFWKRTFTSDSKKDPLNVFNVIYSTLETKTKLPQNFYYVGKILDTDNDSLPTRFELIAPEDLYKQQSNTKSPQTSSPTTKLADQQTQKPPNNKEEPSLRKLQESLDKLDAEKGSLREVLENNTEENDLKELLEYMFKEISDTYNNSVSPQVEPLLSGSVPNSERLVTQVYTEAELVDQLNSHYASYKKGKLPYRELRARALVLLKPQENPYAGGVTPGGEDIKDISDQPQAIKQVQEEVKQEEIVYREYANEQPQERTKKAGVNALKIETPTSSASQQNKVGKGLQVVENPNDNYIVENQQPWKSPENEKRSIVFGSVSNPISERAQDNNKRIEFEQPPVHTEIEEREIHPVVYESQRQVQQIKSPVAVENLPINNNNELPPPKKHELDSHTYQFKSSANIEDDDASVGSGTLPPKQAITGKVSKFKAGETLEEDDNNTGNNTGNIGKIEAREVRSVHHPSPFRKADDFEHVDVVDKPDKSEKFNAYKSYSLRMTPSRREEEDLSKSMKLSRIKPGDLSMIESSIRQSFMSTGKRPPQFKPLSELQVKEDYEKEITRLRAEKEALLKENNNLNLVLKEYEQNPRIIEEPQRDAELKKLLNQQQEKIEALTQEIRALTQENHKLQKRNSALEQYQYANKAEEENHSHYKEKIALQERIAELERELSQYQTGGKQGPLSKSAAQRAAGNKNIVAPKIETANNINVEQVKKAGFPQQQERLDTNPAEISMGQTPYDVDWANTSQPIASVESSAYDVEWPASAYKVSADADLTKAIQGKNPEPNNNKKSIRGRPIETSNPIFGNLKPQIRGLPWTNDLKSFKVACLKEKCPLFENEMVRVGVSSTIVHDNSNHKNMLKLVLYFENKSEFPIDSFETEVINAKGLSKIAKPSHLQAPIEKGRQVKQQIIVAFDKIPFEVLQLLVNIRTAGSTNIETVNLFLPTLITRFMEFKYATAEIFREKWKLKNTNVLKTEEITLDINVIKTAYDFKKYFGYLIDLKPMDEYDFVQGKKSIKLAGVFELDVPNAEYLLKINVLPTHQVVFQIASFEADSNIARFILQTLAFLFKKN